MSDLSHLWQRFLLTSALVAGIVIGLVIAVFGYGNQQLVSINFALFHIANVPLWSVAVVPVTITLIASTIYYTLEGLHHFTEHMRHRSRVHHLETELATLRAHLDRVLEMPEHSAMAPARPASLPAVAGGITDLGPADQSGLAELAGPPIETVAPEKPRRARRGPTRRKKARAPRKPRAERSAARASMGPDALDGTARSAPEAAQLVGADGEMAEAEEVAQAGQDL